MATMNPHPTPPQKLGPLNPREIDPVSHAINENYFLNRPYISYIESSKLGFISLASDQCERMGSSIP